MTIEKIWNELLGGRDVRQNLSQLRKELREGVDTSVLLDCMENQEDKLIECLSHEDPKTRKNAALLLGELEKPEFLLPIYEAYCKEEKLFVKSAYLIGMGHYDYSDYVEDLKVRLEQLTKEVAAPENEKHVVEESRELSALIMAMEGVSRHCFTGFDEAYNIILLTNRNYPEMVKEGLKRLAPASEITVFSAGVMAKVTDLNWIEELRTYQELLFVVEGMQTCAMDADLAADTIVKSGLMAFLEKAHQSEAPFYFRVELRSEMPLSKRGAFIKKLSAQIEKKSGRKLINTPSHYEFEIRLIETKNGRCNVLVKCYTLRDRRFVYRETVIPQSIKPVNAAVVVELTKAYMKKDAQVLDPFCGVGTMLIERHKAVAANTSYGIDVMSETIQKAKENTALAHQIIHYVNRDFFDFKHNYLFDEVITDMPFELGQQSEEGIYALYLDFFSLVGNLLKQDAVMILYTHNRNYIREMAEENHFKIEKEYEISRREKTYAVVLKRD